MESCKLVWGFISDNKTLVATYATLSGTIIVMETVVISAILNRIYQAKVLRKREFIEIVCALLIIKIAIVAKNHIYDMMTPAFSRYIKTTLFNNIIDRYKVNYRDLDIGSIIYNFENIPHNYINLYVDILNDYIPTFCTLVVCTVYMAFLNFKIFCLFCIGTLMFIYLGILRSRETAEASFRDHQLSLDDNNYIQDKINNLFNIYISGTEDLEKKDYNEVRRAQCESSYNLYHGYSVTSIISSAISAIVLFAALMVLYMTQPSNTVIVLIILVNYITFSKRATGYFSYFMGIAGYSEHVDKFLLEIKKVQNSRQYTPRTPADLTGPVVFTKVNFKYAERQLFDNLDLTVGAGERVAVYGKSGSGKSTLVKLLMGFYGIDSGSITINGIDINDIDINDLRKTISMASQTVRIFDTSVVSNLLYGTGQTRDQLTARFSSVLGIFDSLPQGLDTELVVSGSNISGGQKQIIGIIRAMLRDTPMVILDEPTVGLDATVKAAFLNLVKATKGRTVIIITHDPDVFQYVDTVYKLVDGKLAKPTS